MESQRVRHRRTLLVDFEILEATWNFTEDEFDAFNTFYNDTLCNGEGSFELDTTEPDEDPYFLRSYTRVYAFHDKPDFSRSDNLFEVNAKLLVVEEDFTLINNPTAPVVSLTTTYPDDEDEEASCRHTFILSWPWNEGDIVQCALDDTNDSTQWFDYFIGNPTDEQVENETIEAHINNNFDHDEGVYYMLWYELRFFGTLPSGHVPGSSRTDGLVAVRDPGTTAQAVRVFRWDTGEVLGEAEESDTPQRAVYWSKLREIYAEVVGTPTDIQARAIKDQVAAIIGKTKWFRIRSGIAIRTPAVRARASKIAGPILTVEDVYGPTHPTYSKLGAGTLHKLDDEGPYNLPLSWQENSAFNPQQFYLEPSDRFEFFMGEGDGIAEDVEGYPQDTRSGRFAQDFGWDGVPQTVSTEVPYDDATVKWTRDGSDPDSEMPWPPAKEAGHEFNAAVYRQDFAGVIKSRCFKDGCKSPMTAVIIDKRIRFLHKINVIGNSQLSASGCDKNELSGVSCEVVYGGIDGFKDALDSHVCENLGESFSGNGIDPTTRWRLWSKTQSISNTDLRYGMSLGRFLYTELEGFSPSSKLIDAPRIFEYVHIGVEDIGVNIDLTAMFKVANVEVVDGHAAGPGGVIEDHVAVVNEFLEAFVPICTVPDHTGSQLIRFFDIRLSVYDDDEPAAVNPGGQAFDPSTVPTPPREDTVGRELWEEYMDTELDDESEQVYNLGYLWEPLSEWTFLVYEALEGYDLWEEYGGDDRDIPTTEDPVDPDAESFARGEGWEEGEAWTFVDLDVSGYELWDDYEEDSDGSIDPFLSLDGGSGWAVDTSTPPIEPLEPWTIIDYEAETVGYELWDDYDHDNQELLPLAFENYALNSIDESAETSPTTRGSLNLDVQSRRVLAQTVVGEPSAFYDLVAILTSDGKFGNAIRLKGITDISLGAPQQFFGGLQVEDDTLDFLWESNWTIRWWMRVSNVNGIPTLVAQDTSADGFRVEGVTSTAKLRLVVGNNDAVVVSGFYSTGAWTRVVVKFVRGEGFYLQINNDTAEFDSHPDYAIQPGVTSFLKWVTSSANLFNADIDNISIWNRALTSAELAADWNGGDGIADTDMVGGSNFSPTGPWNLTNMVDDSISASDPYTYWRLLILDNNGNTSDIGVGEFELRETASGASAAVGAGGTASASGGADADEAFDGSQVSGNGWSMTNSDAWPQWLQYQFSSEQEVAEYGVGSWITSGSVATKSARDYILQASRDGVTWVNLDYQELQSSWTFGDLKTYTR
tara:strand:- start:29228 stop:33025 length:3798 start_codon:yes stop_codon:yes gene_type:complete